MNVLANEGIESRPITVTKNNVVLTGLSLHTAANPKICPVVYYNTTDTTDSFLKKIRAVLALGPVQINSNDLTNLNYVKDHILLGIQRLSPDFSFLKRKFQNFEIYMKIPLNLKSPHSIVSCNVTSNLLHSLHISETELWNVAFKNSLNQFFFTTLPGQLLYMVTSNFKNGASALCFPDLFQKFCKEHNEDGCYILPSSVEELVILPESTMVYAHWEILELADLVHTINRESVDPEIQMDPVVYYYNRYSNTIKAVARHEEV